MKLTIKAEAEGGQQVNTSSHIQELSFVDKKGENIFDLVQELLIKLSCEKPVVLGSVYPDRKIRNTVDFSARGKDPQEMERPVKAPNGHDVVIGENFVKIDGLAVDCEEIIVELKTADLVHLTIKGIGIRKLDLQIDNLVIDN